MRILTLNTWGGTVFAPLIDLIARESARTDVFCLQEVFSSSEKQESNGRRMNLLEELVQLLPDFSHTYAPTLHGYDHHGQVNFDVAFGCATFIRNSVAYTSHIVPIYEGWDHATLGNHPRNMLAVSLEQPQLLVANIHGLWVPTGKGDTPDRIEQSRRILAFFATQKPPIVLAGDFNLRPTTESVAMLSRKLTNLIAANHIDNTRTELYKDERKYGDYVADYIFTSPELKVAKFEVLPDVVSDHRALAVEIA